MNILFLIGNGFDLGIGIDTRFMDVLPHYIKVDNSNPIIKLFKDEIEQNYDTWASFEEKMGQYTDEIHKKDTSIITFLDYMNCIMDFNKYLQLYLLNEEKKVKYDDTQNIAKIFMNSIYNFKECLNLDPKIINHILDKDSTSFNFINFNYTMVFDNCLEILKKSNIFQTEKRVKSGFFTFTKLNSLGDVIHIHGTLSDNMILGVNDIRQIKNLEFHNLEHIIRYIKPEANEELRNNKNIQAMNMIENANIYCIYGMSLGVTDRKWWFEIAKQLINNSEKQLIIHAYDETHDNSLLENTLGLIDLYKNKFLNYLQFSEYSDNEYRKKISKKIHIIVNKKIFKMKLT